jgi:hypothetical protein
MGIKGNLKGLFWHNFGQLVNVSFLFRRVPQKQILNTRLAPMLSFLNWQKEPLKIEKAT